MTYEPVPATHREVRLARRPSGAPAPGDLEVVEAPLPEGEVLVRNEWMLMASAYRELMKERPGLPLPPFPVGEAPTGRTVGTVVRSQDPAVPVGALVEHFQGWREYAAGPGGAFAVRDRDLLPGPEYFLSNGPTAWLGMAGMAEAGPGDVVFVSGATSGVGSVAGQIAKARGARRVIGSAGSKEKAEYLVEELGFDAAFDRHDGPALDLLRELAPDGIDVFFDNTGGEQFEAAVQLARPGARFALCGALAGQNGDDASAGRPRLDLLTAISRQLVLRPFACFHTPDQIDGWNRQFAQWLGEGRFVYPRTVVEGGVAGAPRALFDLLDRKFYGNVLLRLTGGTDRIDEGGSR
ncbi:MDR family NADP-dependent oxidoreductase [Streptomyces xinghaiensis]|uniref:MDR family NADP-dependent oxidoreductase n=1 Tax=Streptomyces xinghaiensis TaxID=1038928 RepID=UPI0002F6DEAB|nr:NADP-dependent oxidoreductase [Streptomyces xinghaiensis]MZE77801.1 zinc-binding dehydrogenase [Streptomyces sp. SID5475]